MSLDEVDVDSLADEDQESMLLDIDAIDCESHCPNLCVVGGSISTQTRTFMAGISMLWPNTFRRLWTETYADW